MKKETIKKITEWIGRILMLAACGYLGYKLWGYRNSVSIVPSPDMIPLLALLCAVYVGTVLLCPVIYRNLLYATTGRRFSYEKIARLYCRTNLYKYLPGNVLQYVGRNEFAVQEDLSHSRVALATVLEIVVVAGSSLIMTVLLSGSYGLKKITEIAEDHLWLFVVATVIAVVLLIAFLISSLNLSAVSLTIICLILYNSVIFFLNSQVYYGSLRTMGTVLPSGYFWTGIGLYTLAFLAGYVTPGVPGGIGIRELFLVSFFSGIMSEEKVLAGALIFRIISVVGDFLAYVIIEAYAKRPARHKGVLFVTTKNLDYLRNVQEIRLLSEKYDNTDVIGSGSGSYPVRLLAVYTKLLFRDLKGYDKIFVGFAPQLVVPLFKYKLSSCELKIDFFISLLDTLARDRKKISEKGPAGKLCRHFDSETLSCADEVICDTKAHGDFFVKEFGCAPEKIHVLYLEADERIYHPMPQEKPDELKDKYVVLYFGSILPLQGVDVILKAIDICKSDKKLQFIVIGPIKEGMVKPEGENIEYIPWLSQEELASKIAMADLCLAGHFNDSIDKAKRTIPGKAYIYRAMEKPMILGDNTANHELFDENMAGIYYVGMGRPDLLAEAIRKCAEEKR